MLLIAGLLLASVAGTAHARSGLGVEVLSNRADLISAGTPLSRSGLRGASIRRRSA
jgi:hypothetical protein